MHRGGEGPIRGDGILAESVDVARTGLRPELDFARSVFVYRSLFDELASPQQLGLSEEDLVTAWPADDAVTVTYRMPGGHQVHLPLLVPIERLHWYNPDFFRSLYGTSRPVQYYTHAPVHLGEPSGHSALGTILAELDRGAVIITDFYATEEAPNEFEDWASHLHRLEALGVVVANLRGADAEGVLNQYVGNVDFDGHREFTTSSSCYRQFLDARRQGHIRDWGSDGIEVVETISGSEAERLWSMYEGPFDALSGGQVLRAGFDRRTFLDQMSNPDVVKVVRRVGGDITTLSLFVMDLLHCPWLNSDYYEEQYGDAFHTGNILVFTAMVSDESRRGSSYASALITALTEILRLRGTSCVVSFECNSVSSHYIPRIVTDAVARTGRAAITGLETAASSLAFKAISRVT